MIDVESYMLELEERKMELENELLDVKESLGESFDSAVEAGHEAKSWIRANIKSILIGVGLFFLGAIAGVLSGVL
jgi:hypothetical protein